MKLLELQSLSVRYGGVHALESASLSIYQHDVVALMGPNGAGKSTLLKALFGLTPLSRGSIIWKGKAINPHPWEMIARGIVFVPQGRRIFPSLSVQENLEIGGWTLSSTKAVKVRRDDLMEQFPVLAEKRTAHAGTLSGGQQQLLAIARGLMVTPTLLLLDEPTIGLSPRMVSEVFETIRAIKERSHTTIMIVEHNIKSLVHIVNRAVILDKGKIVRDEGDVSKLLEGD
ncbi:MAG: ABC transporter ATP-binding protein, partial [Patescibacteria group bacterium]